MKILDQWIRTDEKTNISYIYTKFEDGSIGMVDEPLTPEEAALWMAKKGF